VSGSQNDCDDWNDKVSPAMVELCGDGIDNDCNGVVDSDCDPCLVAAFNRSYIGCEYYAASTMNSQLDTAFDNNYALVIHNPNSSNANVTIDKGGTTVQTATLTPGQLQVFTLPYDLTLQDSNTAPILVTGGAYHITSDMPISVYQFNPFDFRIGGTNSYTNDASLVLPKSVLTRNYMVTNRQTWELLYWGVPYSLPGFLAIVGTENGTTVQITYNGNVRGGLNRGQSETVTLNAGDVYQVPSRDCGCANSSGCYCSTDYDFTGTRIQVTNPTGHPVAVIGGHDCTFIPADQWACDHLEEMMFPLETWGKHYVATITDYAPINWFRVVSSTNNNTVTFTPSTVHTAVTLQAGEYVEFQATEHFSVDCTETCAVTEFILADDLFAGDSDPAMALLVPTEQFRKDYSFTVPSSMTYNWVNVIKPVAQPGRNTPTVYLDGSAIPEASFTAAIGNSYFGVARLDISSAPYPHTITSDQPFGIMVYGFASYTSYFYPGGLDLNLINSVN